MNKEQRELQQLSHRENLQLLRGAIPFLQEIPDAIYYQLDTAEFHLPIGDVAQARSELEEKLSANIMTYNRSVFNLSVPPNQHLCANLAPAQLTEKEIGLLEQYEQRFTENDVSFVAYQKPLTLINPTESALFKLYEERGLPK